MIRYQRRAAQDRPRCEKEGAMPASEHMPPAPDAGQPVSGREGERAIPASPNAEASDEVTEASEGSFPASDAPPWTSSATRGAPETDATPEEDDEVTEASEESFPASDPPPWTSSAT